MNNVLQWTHYTVTTGLYITREIITILLNGSIDNQKWYVYGKKADFNSLGAKYGISPVIARIMINRGIPEDGFDLFLNGTLNDIHDGRLMNDMELAADIIAGAIDEGKKIRVVGDYDIDGVCSTYILVSALKKLGADVSYAIPDRIKDGYGINTAIIKEAQFEGVDLIITCDNGISAHEACELAMQYGMNVVITDHHEVPEQLPGADAIVDPKQPGDPYPFTDICGAMVAFKLVKVLYENAGIPMEEWKRLLEFAAIATVGDVMPLRDENRIVVKEGLEKLKTTDNIGLNALKDACLLPPGGINAYAIGFILGPCINAGGRLETADIAMELFMADDEKKAEELADHLKDLNDERKLLTEEYADMAVRQVEERFPEDDVKVVYLPDCHESIAGIIAGRIKEYYNHPAIVFTNSGPGLIKGSARSIEKYNMYAKLSEVSELFDKFGGHKLAAGISMKLDNLDILRERLNKESGLTEDDFVRKVWIDVPLPLEYATVDLFEQLERLEPFGQGNEKPVFAQKNVTVLSARTVLNYRNFVKFKLRDAAYFNADGIQFGDSDEILSALAKRDRIDILYYPKLNLFNGRRSIDIQIKTWK